MLLALQLQNHSLRPLLCRQGFELNAVKGGDASQELTPLRSKHVCVKTASHRSLSHQGDYTQGISTVNTAKSVNQSMPVLDVARAGLCMIWPVFETETEQLWMRDRIKSSLTEFEVSYPFTITVYPSRDKEPEGERKLLQITRIWLPFRLIEQPSITSSSFVSNQMLYCFSLGYCIVYHVGVDIYKASIV